MNLGSTSASTAPTRQFGMTVQTSLNGLPIAIGWGQFRASWNLLDYTDFKSTQKSAGGKGALGGGKGSSASYNYSATVIGAIAEGPLQFLTVWNNQTQQDPSTLNLVEFAGDYSQAAWSYMTSAHPSYARTYRGLAYGAIANLALGTSPVLPNLSFEVRNTDFSNAISGKPDADPKDVFTQPLLNQFYGVAFPSAQLGDLSVYSSYCRAAGLVVSPYLSSATSTLQQLLGNLLDATNSQARTSSGLLQIVPRGDQDLSANGATYTAPAAPEYDLVDSDFIADGDSKPIKVSRKRASDQMNVVQVRFNNRAIAYNPDVVRATDDAHYNEYGPRVQQPQDWGVFCDADAAQLSANLWLGRQHYRNVYQFTIGRRFARLDCLDIVSLTHAGQQISDVWVKITDIERNANGTFRITAEDYLPGTGAAPQYGKQANSAAQPNYNVTPGNTNTPVAFVPPYQLAKSRGPELWLLASGASANWGGCQVWISTDGTDYRLVDVIEGKARQGVLSANIAAGADPDTTHTLSVDLTQSAATMESATQAAADAFQSLIFVDGEVMAYETATLTATNKYDITYLRRGAYGTVNSLHNLGAEFAVLDGNGLLIYPFDKSQIGSTVYLKLPAFNIYNQAQQDLSDVSATTIVVGGAPTAYAPSNLSVSASVKGLVLKWTNAANVGVEAVEVWRSASSSFGGATKIHDAAAYTTSWTDNTVTSNTQYWYWIRYRDVAGNEGGYSPSTGGAGASATAGQVGTNDIQDSAVTTAKVGPGAITGPKIGAFAVDFGNLASAVSSAINTATTNIAALTPLVANSQAAIRSLYNQVSTLSGSILSLTVALNGQAEAIGTTVAYANQQLTQQFQQAISAEAQARLDLAAIVYGLTTGNTETALAARVTVLEGAVANLQTGKAEASALTALDAQINTPSTGLAAQVLSNTEAIATLDPSSASATIAQTASAVRAQGLQLDALGSTFLQILNALNSKTQQINATLAFYNSTITTTVTQGLSASAQALADLGAVLQDQQTNLSALVETNNSASVSRDADLQSQVTSNANSITSLSAGLATANSNIAGNSTAISSLNATVASQGTTIASHSASITSLNSSVGTLTSGLSTANTNITANSSAISGLTTAVGNKSTIFAQSGTPTAIAAGDLWIDTGNGNTIKSWTGSAWVARPDLNKVTTYAQASAPTAAAIGDIWINTASSANTMWRWNGSAWVSVDNSTIAANSSAITALQNTVNDPSTGVAATAAALASLSTTVSTQGGAISSLSSSVTALNSGLSTANSNIAANSSAISTLTTSVGNKSTVFVQSGTPTAIAAGDMWIDTGNGNSIKTWTGSAWVARPDLNKATTFAQSSAPTAGAVGDIWINTSGGTNAMLRWNGSTWAAVDNATIASTASALSSLSTTVAGNTSSITSLSTSISGIYSQWGVQIDTNGAMTSFVHLDGSAASSNFVIAAANLYFYDPTAGATAMFAITGGQAFFNCPLNTNLINVSTIIANDVVVTGHLQANAVTAPSVVTGSASTMAQSPSFSVLVSNTITTDGGDVMVDFTDWFARSGGHSPTCTYKVVGPNGDLTPVNSGGSGVSTAQVVSGTALDTSVHGTPGTYSYYLKASANGDPSCTSEAPVLRLTELKR